MPGASKPVIKKAGLEELVYTNIVLSCSDSINLNKNLVRGKETPSLY